MLHLFYEFSHFNYFTGCFLFPLSKLTIVLFMNILFLNPILICVDSFCFSYFWVIHNCRKMSSTLLCLISVSQNVNSEGTLRL